LPADNRGEQARVPAARRAIVMGGPPPIDRINEKQWKSRRPIDPINKKQWAIDRINEKQWIAGPQVVFRGNSGLAAHR
jgi:hypothetical protein